MRLTDSFTPDALKYGGLIFQGLKLHFFIFENIK